MADLLKLRSALTKSLLLTLTGLAILVFEWRMNQLGSVYIFYSLPLYAACLLNLIYTAVLVIPRAQLTRVNASALRGYPIMLTILSAWVTLAPIIQTDSISITSLATRLVATILCVFGILSLLAWVLRADLRSHF